MRADGGRCRAWHRGFDISRHNFDAFVVGSHLVRNQGEVTTPSGLTIPQFAHCYSSAADIPFVVGFREHAQRRSGPRWCVKTGGWLHGSKAFQRPAAVCHLDILFGNKKPIVPMETAGFAAVEQQPVLAFSSTIR